VLGALALLICAGVVVAIVVSTGASSGGGSAAAGTTATGAATVERRDLVATDTESGTLSYADGQTVYNRLSGTITSLPQIGQVIQPGHALFAVDNEPVLLLAGSTPAFRDLTYSDETGPDIYELNRNLVDLGYNPDSIIVDDTWQAATTAGIDELQTQLDETVTGTLTLGRVVFLPGRQMIQTIDTTAGSSNGGASGSDATGGGADAVAVLGTSSTKLVVTVDLGASVQSEAAIGEKVTIEMPDGSTQNGKVTAVSPVAQSSSSSSDDGSSGGGGSGGDSGSDGSGGSGSGSGSGATVPVTIELDKTVRGGGLDQASVSVNFVQSKARNVLSVPVTALLATSGSNFAVQEASSPRKLIPVKTGLFAAGYVEITGAGIHPGLRVTDSQG
jgi:hypothetical protein